MIKNFTDFISEELDHSTYFNAASKLIKLGGKHELRARKLEDWTYQKLANKYGEYSLNMNVISVGKGAVEYWPISKEDEDFTDSKNKLIKKGPILCAFTGTEMFDPKDNYPGKEIYDMRNIWINFIFRCLDRGNITGNIYSVPCFSIKIFVKWDEEKDEKIMLVEKVDIDHGANDWDAEILFGERKDALKFKRTILNNITDQSFYKDLRDFFMEYSTSEELEKFVKLIKEIPVNNLYK